MREADPRSRTAEYAAGHHYYHATGRVDITPRVTHRFKLEQIEEAYGLFGQQSGGVLKVAITL